MDQAQTTEGLKQAGLMLRDSFVCPQELEPRHTLHKLSGRKVASIVCSPQALDSCGQGNAIGVLLLVSNPQLFFLHKCGMVKDVPW